MEQKHTELMDRAKHLGIEIFQLAQHGDYEGTLPKDLVFIGNNTFWSILEIREPEDAITFVVHDAAEIDNEADYLLDIGTYIGLRLKYDQAIDKFHILGYTGTQTKTAASQQKRIFDLEQYLYTVGKLRPGVGLKGLEIHQSTRNTMFATYDEPLFNKLDMWFEFQQDTLKALYISKYQLETEHGIRPKTSSKSEIQSIFGIPDSTRRHFTFLGKAIKNVEVLAYKGIEFVTLKNDLMLIKIH